MNSPGSYTCQIFWKGDPGIENFIIRFTTDEALRKWANQIETQRRKYRESSSHSHSHARHSDSNRSQTSGTSNNEFVYLQNQPPPENPYKDTIEEDDDDDEDAETLAGSASSWSLVNSAAGNGYPHDRNGSSASLRSRSTTGESTQASMSSGSTRAPPRFAPGSFQQQQSQPLALRTRDLQQTAPSPGPQNMDSYFSPTGESPASSARISAGSGMYPFPAQQVPQNGYYVDGHGATRFTAPAMPRQAPQRELSGGLSNGYAPPGRGPAQRPGFPAGMHGSQQGPGGSRNRSASSPDIHNPSRIPGRGAQPPIPDMPASYQHPAHMINRSQNNSPNMPPGRASPQISRERQYSNSGVRMEQSPTDYSSYGGGPTRPEHNRIMQQQQQQYYPNRAMTPVSRAPSQQASYSPPRAQQHPGSHPSAPSSATSTAPSTTFQDTGGPSQLRVKVSCPAADVVLTLVVPTTITYASLRDRIDAKLQRSTQYSLSDRGPREGQVKLKYLDDDDFVSIQSDEDVQTAFEAWREANLGPNGALAAQMQADGGFGMGGLLGEIELFCQR